MKYVTQKEENLTWLVLSACWAGGGLIAWLSSLMVPGQAISAMTALVVACGIALVGLALRVPILYLDPHTYRASDLLVLLLVYAATTNWLGCLLLRTESLVQALPAILVVLLAEVWIHCQFYVADSPIWLRPSEGNACGGCGIQSLPTAGDGFEADHRSPPKEVLPFAEAPVDQSLASQVPSFVPESQPGGISEVGSTVRTTVDGIDEHGRRYLSGEIHIEMAAGQAAENSVIGFCPAFEGDPEADFEVADERIEGRLVHCSPAGMRIDLRRVSGVDRNEPLPFKMQWYAVQSDNFSPSLKSYERPLP